MDTAGGEFLDVVPCLCGPLSPVARIGLRVAQDAGAFLETGRQLHACGRTPHDVAFGLRELDKRSSFSSERSAVSGNHPTKLSCIR